MPLIRELKERIMRAEKKQRTSRVAVARSRARKTAKDAGLSVANERKTRGKEKEEEKMKERG